MNGIIQSRVTNLDPSELHRNQELNVLRILKPASIMAKIALGIDVLQRERGLSHADAAHVLRKQNPELFPDLNRSDPHNITTTSMSTNHSHSRDRQLVVAHNDAGPMRQIVHGHGLTPEQAQQHNRAQATGTGMEQRSQEEARRVNKINEAIIEKQRSTGMSRNEAYLALVREGHELFR